ncbi:hypothetical protein Pyn_16991 [Prunus yedoensis var. nudiflora]|uniref:Uncharacterized protein n=1 Tax=Prunus yedoensis var. nudiflora TaxID=2094558 RepID=A0A314Y882_PRUYE|nr:hypothetical protein Pyn_16991 [Prunus yedoensis var. nudiflora]
MDQKAWLWRKRSSEKTILATNAIPLGRIEEENMQNSTRSYSRWQEGRRAGTKARTRSSFEAGNICK